MITRYMPFCIRCCFMSQAAYSSQLIGGISPDGRLAVMAQGGRTGGIDGKWRKGTCGNVYQRQRRYTVAVFIFLICFFFFNNELTSAQTGITKGRNARAVASAGINREIRTLQYVCTKNELYQGVYAHWVFKLDHLPYTKPIFCQKKFHFFIGLMQHFPFPSCIEDIGCGRRWRVSRERKQFCQPKKRITWSSMQSKGGTQYWTPNVNDKNTLFQAICSSSFLCMQSVHAVPIPFQNISH